MKFLLFILGSINMKKCKSCPYHLGKIKCITDLSPQCKETKSKKPPFPEAEIKENKKCKLIKH